MDQQATTPTNNITLDDSDLLILMLLYNQDHDPTRKGVPRYSLQELNAAIPKFRSIATIHERVTKLEAAGYIDNPGPRVPRSRTITFAGIERLKRERLLPTTGHTQTVSG